MKSVVAATLLILSTPTLAEEKTNTGTNTGSMTDTEVLASSHLATTKPRKQVIDMSILLRYIRQLAIKPIHLMPLSAISIKPTG